MNQNKSNNKWRTIGLLLVIVVIIILFIVLVDLSEVFAQLTDANPFYIGAASVAFIFGLVGFAARWRSLLSNKPTLPFTFHASNLGHAGNIIIPFRAGEVIRIVVMGASESTSLTESTTSVVVERLFEQLMRLLTLGFAILLGLGLSVSLSSAVGGIALLVLGFGAILWLVNHQETTLEKGSSLLSKIPRVTEETARHSLSDLLGNLKSVSQPRQFARILFWSILTWVLFWAFFYLTLDALDNELSTGQQFAISLGALALSPPSAPTQPGIFHASIVLPLSALGIDPEMLTAYSILLHVQEMVWVVAFGIWGLIATGVSLSSIRKKL
ncbi:MAG: lysylphosphatidylglycerol synthase transmembrane domain-containing protein [Candidatus Promineifilaceae bacterium]|nr:lysylphosphatidylglycerol synthase transmembrane domain-containing protein [Candidatus Promineifilaceae bacterium]